MFRYYVRALPAGRALAVPLFHATLQALYFTTISKLTGLEYSGAVKILHSGETIKSDGIEFWAVDLHAKLIPMPKPEPLELA